MVVTTGLIRTVTGVNSTAQELLDACYDMNDSDGFEISMGPKTFVMTIGEWRAILNAAMVVV